MNAHPCAEMFSHVHVKMIYLYAVDTLDTISRNSSDVQAIIIGKWQGKIISASARNNCEVRREKFKNRLEKLVVYILYLYTYIRRQK